MPRTAIILVNGILTDPRKDNAWTDFSVDWLNNHTAEPTVVTGYEYNAEILFGPWKNLSRAERIIERVKEYTAHGDRVILVGHSNGCDIIAHVIQQVEVDEVHLISPATDEKTVEMGIVLGNVDRVHIYGSTSDMALKWGAKASRIFTLGLGGYGSLGLRGPAFAAQWRGIVFDHSINTYGHGTWLSPTSNLIDTLKQVARNSGLTIIK